MVKVGSVELDEARRKASSTVKALPLDRSDESKNGSILRSNVDMFDNKDASPKSTKRVSIAPGSNLNRQSGMRKKRKAKVEILVKRKDSTFKNMNVDPKNFPFDQIVRQTHIKTLLNK